MPPVAMTATPAISISFPFIITTLSLDVPRNLARGCYRREEQQDDDGFVMVA
jgi:hypothetical protein